MIKIDCHVHSMYSHDAFQTIETILDRIEKKGLDGAIIVDHNNMDETERLMTYVAERYPDIEKRPILMRGAEYSTEMGHLMILGLTTPLETILEMKSKRFDCHQIVEESKKQGAFIILAHPYRIKGRYPDEWLLRNVDAIEVYNARSAILRGHYNANQMAVDAAKVHRLPITAGSDGHLSHEIGNGYIAIETSKAEFSISQLKNYAIKAYGWPSHPINECISQSYKAIMQKNTILLLKQIFKGLFSIIQWANPLGHRLKGQIMSYNSEVDQ